MVEHERWIFPVNSGPWEEAGGMRVRRFWEWREGEFQGCVVDATGGPGVGI